MPFIKEFDFKFDMTIYNDDGTIRSNEEQKFKMSCLFNTKMYNWLRQQNYIKHNDGSTPFSGDSFYRIRETYDNWLGVEAPDPNEDWEERIGMLERLFYGEGQKDSTWRNIRIPYSSNMNPKTTDFNATSAIEKIFKEPTMFNFPLNYDRHAGAGNRYIYPNDYVAYKLSVLDHSDNTYHILNNDIYYEMGIGFFNTYNQNDEFKDIPNLNSSGQSIYVGSDFQWLDQSYGMSGSRTPPQIQSTNAGWSWSNQMNPFGCGTWLGLKPSNAEHWVYDPILGIIPIGRVTEKDNEGIHFCFNVFPEEAWYEDGDKAGINFDYFGTENGFPQLCLLSSCTANARNEEQGGGWVHGYSNQLCSFDWFLPFPREVNQLDQDMINTWKDFFGPDATFGGNSDGTKTKDNWTTVDTGAGEEDDDTDDNPNVPTSEPGGGNGLNDTSSDPMPDEAFNGLPSKDGAHTGFMTIYNPTESELHALANFLWTDDFVDNIKKLMDDPFAAIIGLNIIPVIPNNVGSMVNVRVGNTYAKTGDTNIQMHKVPNQTGFYDMGFIEIKSSKLYHNYLDWSPYTKAHIYLPFIGMVNLSIDEIMNTKLRLGYKIDYVSGACVAILRDDNKKRIIGQYTGNCAVQVPMTGKDMSQFMANSLHAVQSVTAGAIFGGGAGALASAPSAAMNIAMSKPTYQKNGSISGSSSYLGMGYPYVIIERPKWVKPDNGNGQGMYEGIPAWSTKTVGSCSGFTKFSNVRIKGTRATDDEKNEIRTILENGIIV